MTQQTEDPRPLHRRAMNQTEAIVAAVTQDQLTLPTPCDDYDVRALLRHILGGLNRVAVAGEGGDALATPSLIEPVPDGGWLAAYQVATAHNPRRPGAGPAPRAPHGKAPHLSRWSQQPTFRPAPPPGSRRS